MWTAWILTRILWTNCLLNQWCRCPWSTYQFVRNFDLELSRWLDSLNIDTHAWCNCMVNTILIHCKTHIHMYLHVDLRLTTEQLSSHLVACMWYSRCRRRLFWREVWTSKMQCLKALQHELVLDGSRWLPWFLRLMTSSCDVLLVMCWTGNHTILGGLYYLDLCTMQFFTHSMNTIS